MPTYEIEQYELHAMKYRVEADSEAEAIAKLLNGEADPMDNSLEYIEVADDYGLPVDENRDLVDQLRKLGIAVGDDIIPSVRSIEEAE
jgi:type III secretion system FlhB-like substrate exporter